MKEKTSIWFELAESDLDFAKNILKGGSRPHYAVHYCHQAIEKILKALVQEKTNEDPKRTHNFKTLCIQSKVEFPPDVEDFLTRLSPHYLASRYPEDMKKFYSLYTASYAQNILNETERVFSWFKNMILKK